MNPSELFQIANPIALIGWLLIIIAPNSMLCKKLVMSYFLSLLLALIYWITFGLSLFAGPVEGAGFNSLEAVKKLFSNDWALLAGWIHYLAFDLLVGTIVYQKLAKKHLIIRTICLILTFLLGPIGWSLSLLFNQRDNA